jgi:hypothetical protein
MSMLQLSRARRARASVPSTRSLAVIPLAAAALLAACAAPGPSDDPIEGTLQIAIIEDHAAGTMIRQPLLQRADGSMLRLVFDTPPPVGAGTRVKLTGFFEAKALLHVQHLEVVRSTELGTDDITVARSAVSTMTPVKHKTAVIMFNFQNDTSQPQTQDSMRHMAFTGTNSISNYLKQWSYGLIELTGKVRTDGDVFGWFTVPFNNNTNCNWDTEWIPAVRPMAAAAGFDPAGYDHVIFYWVGTEQCGFGGVSWSSSESALNGYGSDAGAHELMHNLGIGHSDGIRCTDASGNRVSLGSTSTVTCTQIGYGDNLDTQGYPYDFPGVHINSFHKAKAGWLSTTGNMVTQDTTGTRTIVAQESASSLIQSLRIPRDGDSYFHVERRQPIGFDAQLPSSVTSGVLVRVVPDYPGGESTLIVDMQPTTDQVTDAALQVGQTFSEPGRGISIRLDSANASGATVSVTMPPADTNDGSGIQGQYFSNMTLAGTPVVTRTDPTIAFSWGEGAPAAGVPVDGFSVRWTGQIKPRYSESYTFSTISDDGVRVWVNGQQVINNWTDHGPKEDIGTPIFLNAGQRYDVVMEFYENGGGATAKLFWKSPTQVREIIPRTRLYPPSTAGLPGMPSNPSPANQATGVATNVTVSWTADTNTSTHDIFFGTASSPPFIGNQSSTTYTPGTLQPNTTYFWRLVERNWVGTTSGPTWQFTTAPASGNLFSDNFESGNTSNWTLSGGSWSVQTDGTKVMRQAGSTGDARALSNPSPWTNQVVTARVKPLTWNGTDRFVAVLARAQNATNYYYVTLRSSNKLELKKLINGTPTTLATKTNFTVATNTWYTVKLEVIGTTLRAYVNGTQQLTATDTQYASGKAGLATFNATASFDDVTVTSQ